MGKKTRNLEHEKNGGKKQMRYRFINIALILMRFEAFITSSISSMSSQNCSTDY